MKIKIIETKSLIQPLEIISEFIDEVKLKMDDDGLNVVAIDPSNVAIIEFKFNKNWFTEFEHDNDILCINLKDFVKILKRCKNKNTLIIESDSDNKIDICIEGNIKRNFQLPLIDIDIEDKDMQEI